jgi:UDP-N-acetylglucosamine 3-dehydrogenase
VNWVTPTKIRTLRVTGTKGVLFADYILQTVQMFGGNLLRSEPQAEYDYQKLVDLYKSTDKVEFGIEKQEPLKVQLTELYHKIQGKPSKICSSEDAELAVRLAYQSFEKANKGIF